MARSQALIVVSLEPVRKNELEASKAMQRTQPLWPMSTFDSFHLLCGVCSLSCGWVGCGGGGVNRESCVSV